MRTDAWRDTSSQEQLTTHRVKIGFNEMEALSFAPRRYSTAHRTGKPRGNAHVEDTNWLLRDEYRARRRLLLLDHVRGAAPRERELAALTSAGVLRTLRARTIRRITFAEL